MRRQHKSQTAILSLVITAVLLLPQYAASYENLKELQSLKYELFSCFLEFWALAAIVVCYITRWFVRPWTISDRDKRALGILQLFLAGTVFYILFSYGHNYFEDSIWNVIYYLSGGILRVLISVTGMLLVGTDWRRLANWWRKEYPQLKNVFQKTYFISGAVLSMVVLELLTASKVDGMLHRFRLVTIFYFILLESFLYACTRKVKISATATVGISYLIGVANYFVELFRGNYITFSDLTVVRTALNVIGQYRFVWDKYLVYASGISLVFIGLAWLVKEGKEKRTGKQWAISGVQVAALLMFTGALYGSGYMGFGAAGLSWNSTICIRYTGYLPYFISNMKQNQSYTIEGYNLQDVEGILSQVEVQDAVPEIKSPHIIVIMNEAFSDLQVLGKFKTNEDYLPFYHSLEGAHVQKGFLDLSVTGGPTSVTEFEFLTGVSMQNLPTGCLPYTQYLKKETSSLVSLLKEQDIPYQTIAFHPYYASGYNRTSVYKALGFDKTVFYEDLVKENRVTESQDLLRGMLTDKANYREVIRMFEERDKQAPFFLFNVTIQNHGGYGNEGVVFPNPIEANGHAETNKANTYLSLVRESDEALKELLSYFETVEEPVMVCMFGDHQPNVDEELSRILGFAERQEGDVDINRYKVPYLVWTNYDNALEPAKMMSSNFLASYLVDESEVRRSTYFRYLSQLRMEYPSITRIATWKQEDEDLFLMEQPEQEAQINDYKKVTYNLIFDIENTLNRYFTANKNFED